MSRPQRPSAHYTQSISPLLCRRLKVIQHENEHGRFVGEGWVYGAWSDMAWQGGSHQALGLGHICRRKELPASGGNIDFVLLIDHIGVPVADIHG